MKHSSEGRIILIEDDIRWLSEITDYLQKMGYDVSPCDRYEKAVELLNTCKFDLGILDISLGGHSRDVYGLWLLQDLIISQQIPVVIVSAYVDPSISSVAIRKLGVFSTMSKTDFSLSELTTTLQSAQEAVKEKRLVTQELDIEQWQQGLHMLYAQVTQRQLGGDELIEVVRSTILQHRRHLVQLLMEEQKTGMPLSEAKQEEARRLRTRITELENELEKIDLGPILSNSSKTAIISTTPKRQELRKLLIDRFDEEEIRDLCFDLNVDYDKLRGEGKAGKVRELILQFVRLGKLDVLMSAVDQVVTKDG